MRLGGGRQMGLALPVSMAYMTMFVRPIFSPSHESMFICLRSNE